jgi:hypothetical protein
MCKERRHRPGPASPATIRIEEAGSGTALKRVVRSPEKRHLLPVELEL